jgi:hypothetical protein
VPREPWADTNGDATGQIVQGRGHGKLHRNRYPFARAAIFCSGEAGSPAQSEMPSCHALGSQTKDAAIHRPNESAAWPIARPPAAATNAPKALAAAISALNLRRPVAAVVPRERRPDIDRT